MHPFVLSISTGRHTAWGRGAKQPPASLRGNPFAPHPLEHYPSPCGCPASLQPNTDAGPRLSRLPGAQGRDGTAQQQHYDTHQTLSQPRSAGAEPCVGLCALPPHPGGTEQGCPLPAVTPLPSPCRARLQKGWLLPSALDFKYFKPGCFWTLGFSYYKLYQLHQSWGIIWEGVKNWATARGSTHRGAEQAPLPQRFCTYCPRGAVGTPCRRTGARGCRVGAGLILTCLSCAPHLSLTVTLFWGVGVGGQRAPLPPGLVGKGMVTSQHRFCRSLAPNLPACCLSWGSGWGPAALAPSLT